MVSLLVVFYLFLALFGIIGGIRGWAKEILVGFSVVLALALIAVIENLVPGLGRIIKSNPNVQLALRLTIVIALSFFGYQSPKFSRLSKASEKRDQIQDVLLGIVFGILSGYFIVGTLWSFMHTADYPFAPFITKPKPTDPLGNAALNMIKYLPPVWLGNPTNAFIAVVLAFIFVVVVFI